MRQFKKMIFLGNGDQSLIDCYKLHKRLEEGFDILGGLQQSDQGCANIHDKRHSLEKDLKDIIKDIKVALGGIKKKRRKK